LSAQDLARTVVVARFRCEGDGYFLEGLAAPAKSPITVVNPELGTRG